MEAIHGELSLSQIRSLRRKIDALSCEPPQKLLLRALEPCHLLTPLRDTIESHTKQVHDCAMKKWRERTLGWSVSSSSLYHFIKNPWPMKMPVVCADNGPTNHPLEVQAALTSYWSKQESWPSHMSLAQVLDTLEDRYSFLLPRYEWSWDISPKDLALAAKYAKNSATGVDAWGVSELKVLPESAWICLLWILKHNFPSLQDSLATLVRKDPIQKDQSAVSLPQNVRPLDVYSCILRIYSRAVYNVCIQWRR